ncbi:MAG: tetrahydrofolate dehydrogenase/cyclohydrolase catalytic domain-containing protein [Candidatus Cloacimonadota bacterium]|nr:tetrahydrofolate dehydrogenase/cyclohydrolase catalytic domain-containing protein [Candidatus Cloacimonadota bacterium]
MTKLLKGKPVTKAIYNKLSLSVEKLIARGINPFLQILMAGNDPASEYYAYSVIKKAAKIGIKAELCKMDKKISECKLAEKLNAFNENPNIHGILLQIPLPQHISFQRITSAINPDKDVDCLNPINTGKLLLGKEGFIPCTPAAVLELIKFYNIKTDGANITILGRSNIVGKPLANLLLQKSEIGNATVTICHSHTKNLAQITAAADILIVAIGQPLFVKSDMVSEFSLVIDVGINRILDKNKSKSIYVGDVDFAEVSKKVAAITPVPGGIGSITTASVLSNVIQAAKHLK